MGSERRSVGCGRICIQRIVEVKWRYCLLAILLCLGFSFGISERAEAASQTLTLNPSGVFEYNGSNHTATVTTTSGGFFTLSSGQIAQTYIYLKEIALGATIPANSLVYLPVRYVTESVNFAPFTTTEGVTIENQNCFQPESMQIYCQYWLRTTENAVSNPKLYTRTLRPDTTSFNVQLPPSVSVIDLGEDAGSVITDLESSAEASTGSALSTGTTGANNAGADAEQKGQTLLSGVVSFLSVLNNSSATTCETPATSFNQFFTLPAIDFCAISPPPVIMGLTGLACMSTILFLSINISRKIMGLYNEILGGK